jgi:predicted RNA-binding protein with PIN domain
MRAFDSALLDTLAAAVEAARAVLRDLDGDEIPAPLQRIAASAAGRLPPPLASRVLRELDRNEWFRGKAAEAFDGEGDEAPGAFLERPEGWWATVATAAAERRARAAEEQRVELARRTEVSAARLEEAKRRLKEAKAETADTKTQAERRIEELRRRLARETATDDGPDRREEIESLHRRLVAAGTAAEEAGARVAALQEEVRRLRRERAAAERRLAAGTSSSLPADPVELARFLDLQEAALGRAQPSGGTAPAPVSPLRLPAGVAPDAGEALRWLGTVTAPVSIVVDGYNVLHKLDPATRGGSVERRRLGDELARWRRLASSRHRVVIVYDSGQPEEPVGEGIVGGIEVRFAADGRSADEEVIRLAGSLVGPVVVISSDREVREGAEAAGALTLWAEAVAGWVTKR